MNRVIDGVDLDGLEWSQSTTNMGGEIFTTYTLKLKVINSSGIVMSNKDVESYALEIAKFTEEIYTNYKEKYETKVELEFVDPEKIDRKNDFYLEFVNNLDIGVLGRVDSDDKIGDTQHNRIRILAGLFSELTAKVAAHEIGHTGGLRHEDDEKNPKHVLKSMKTDNHMNFSGLGGIITPEQMREISKHIPADKKTVKNYKDVGEYLAIPAQKDIPKVPLGLNPKMRPGIKLNNELPSDRLGKKNTNER